MFTKILIANRGEIACRILQTARRLGIKTVAVFSSIDENARFVSQADEAFELGPPPPQHSYLNGARIIELALASGAEAIHPGYGFLSENAEFADACAQAGLVFIGPSADVIRAMGNKDQAKSIIEEAGIPSTPGYIGKDQNIKAFKKAAKKIGYPILLKAASGGGGKGMRLVQTPDELDQATESAKRESKASFGDDTLFLEKYIATARHVEMQVFADSHGNAVHLFDRDCSTQRRHQKIIEEAPAPQLSDSTRQAMQAASIKILETIHYLGAGTIEYLVDNDGQFYFMEMNTRLQVEHPVTEKITGLDLVEWQLRVAAGEPLPLQQNEIQVHGHAIEARLCAENPEHEFAPSIGTLAYLEFPEEDAHIRVDTGVRQDDDISLYYDSMIAKIIAHANKRDDAILQLKEALSETFIVGVDSNTEFLIRILQENDFRNGTLSTRFIDQHPDLFNPPAISDQLIVLASLFYATQLISEGHQLSHASEDATSPWFLRDHWRLNAPKIKSLMLWNAKEVIRIELSDTAVEFNNNHYETGITWQDDYQLSATINDESVSATIIPVDNTLHIFHHGQHYTLYLEDPDSTTSNPFETETHLGSPMPGNVIEINVKPDDFVKKGDRLVTLEAMKMEHHIVAPADGMIKSIHCAAGDSVVEGAMLIEFEKN